MLRNLILLLCLVATQASAGAWPRQKGSGFASIATRLEFDETYTLSPSYNSIYLEYGLNGRHTLGVDAGQSSDGATRTIAFLRMPLFETKRGNPVAIELGLGKIEEQIVLRPGMSWGARSEIRLAGSGRISRALRNRECHAETRRDVWAEKQGRAHADPAIAKRKADHGANTDGLRPIRRAALWQETPFGNRRRNVTERS